MAKINPELQTLTERITKLEQSLAQLQARQDEQAATTGKQEENVPDALAVSLLDWWQTREDDVRRLVFDRYPVPLRTMMHRAGDDYLGRTQDRYLIRVSVEDWNKVQQEQAEQVREIAAAQKENVRHSRWDEIDRRMGLETVKKESPWDDEMMLNEAVAQNWREWLSPEKWLFSDFNQARGVQEKLP